MSRGESPNVRADASKFEELEQAGGIEGGVESSAVKTPAEGFLLAEQVESEAAQEAKVGGGVAVDPLEPPGVADERMSGASTNTNLGHRSVGLLGRLPVPATFVLGRLGPKVVSENFLLSSRKFAEPCPHRCRPQWFPPIQPRSSQPVGPGGFCGFARGNLPPAVSSRKSTG